MEQPITAYTDGSGHKAALHGGWGTVIDYAGHIITMCGGITHQTNNRMELVGPLMTLHYLEQVPLYGKKVLIYSDSQYVVRGMTEWIMGWRARDWRTSGGEKVKNIDLWDAMWRVVVRARARGAEVDWQWVRGHSGIAGNELADRLANLGLVELRNVCAKELAQDPVAKAMHIGTKIPSPLPEFEPDGLPFEEHGEPYRWTIPA